MKAGSKAIFAIFDKLWKVSFSLHAHTPTVNIPNPSSFKRNNKMNELETKIKNIPKIKH